MAVWKRILVGYEVKINDVDHPPPHCHVRLDRRSVKVDLMTLSVLDPPPHELPHKLRRALRHVQEDLLAAWENVRIVPPGSSPGVW